MEGNVDGRTEMRSDSLCFSFLFIVEVSKLLGLLSRPKFAGVLPRLR